MVEHARVDQGHGGGLGAQPLDNSVFVLHGRHHTAQEQVGIFLASIGLKVISLREAADQVKAGTPTTFEIVAAGLRSATCALVLLTGDDLAKLRPAFGKEDERLQPRPNVIFEAGCALATLGVERTVLVGVDPVDLMSDVEGLHCLTLDNEPSTRRALAGRLQSAGCVPDLSGDAWLDPAQGGDFKLAVVDGEADEALSEERLRGIFTGYAVDSALALDLSHTRLYEEMAHAIHQRQPLELKLHYVGARMAEYWMQVCEEGSYGHQYLATVTAEAMPEILDAANLSGPVNFASLGPGDGKGDLALLAALQEAVDLEIYFLVDISIELLQFAVNAVRTADSLRRPERDFGIKPILADFEENLRDLEPFLAYDEGTPTFYALTGYTLGNAREEKVIEGLQRIMRDDDILMVDARLHGAGEIDHDDQISESMKDELKRPYSSEAVRRFAFGPVAVASDFAVRYDEVQIDHEFHVGRSSSVPHAINVHLNCSGLDRSEGFRSWVQGRSRLARFARVTRRLQLASVTYYDFESLGTWFDQKGFDVLWKQARADIGLFVLRRKRDIRGDPTHS